MNDWSAIIPGLFGLFGAIIGAMASYQATVFQFHRQSQADRRRFVLGKLEELFSLITEMKANYATVYANRFKPVVVYLGPFSLPSGGSGLHKITLPKYIGSVRTMVVAANAKTSAYGAIEKATPVRSPLMALATVPRKISPSEKVLASFILSHTTLPLQLQYFS